MKQTNKKGFAPILIVVIVLAIGLVAALGYIFYQNMNKKDDTVANTTSTQASNTSTTKPDYTGYLVLDDWGVKFKIPALLSSTNVNYYKTSNQISNNMYEGVEYSITTARIEALGDGCSHTSGFYFNPPTHIYRSTTLKNDPNEPEPAGLLKKINDLYYYQVPAQSACSDKFDNSFNDERLALIEMLKSIEAK
jgi:hypothetical protein